MRRLLVIAAALAATFPPASARAQTTLARGVVATGGGSVNGGAHRIVATIGQPVIGASDGRAVDACHGFWCGGALATLDAPGGAGDGRSLPESLAFGLPAPNPTRGVVQFALALPEPARARLVVVDVSGRHVATVHDGALPAGRHRLGWSGRGEGGGPLRAGVYYARLDVDGRAVGRRTVVLIP